MNARVHQLAGNDVRGATHRTNSRKRRRKTVSVTGILKQFVLLVLETSSVHGFNHISARARHPVENFLWVFFVILGAYGAYYFAHSTLRRYENSPTVISLERNYQEWNTTFPAATICPHNKIDVDVSENVIKKWFGKTANTTEAVEWLSALFSANFDNFDQLEIEDRLPAKQYLKVLSETAFKFHSTVTTSSSESKLTRFLTERGLCYAFNSAIAPYNTLESWVANTQILADSSIKDNVFRGNPLEGDMSCDISDLNSAYTVDIHSPFELPDISRPPILSPEPKYLSFQVTALSTVASEDLRGLAVSQRKCRFIEESNLESFPVYSYNHCKSECRMNLANQLCGCIPYFYRPIDGYPTCSVQGMKCLGRHKERLITLKGEKCECLPSCEEDTYNLHFLHFTPWYSHNMKFALLKFPRSRLKRDIFFTRSDLLVQLGGTASLCLGCSVLSFCEFLYLFTLRLILFISYKFRS